MRTLFLPLAVVCLLACSQDSPPPVGPAGKLTVLAAPTNLRIEALTDSSVRVAWDAVDGATDYDINYKPVGGQWKNWPHRGATRLYSTIYMLEPNTEYRWAVRAENSDGPSRWVFAENFTTLSEEEEAQQTLPVGSIAEGQTSAEMVLFQEACLEIQASLERLLPNALRMKGGWETIPGEIGNAQVSRSSIRFENFSISGQFLIRGTIRTGYSKYSDENPAFPARGDVWIGEKNTNRRSFFIGTKHPYETDRRGRFTRFTSHEFVEMGQEFLLAIKDDLVEVCQFALATSRRNREIYVDGHDDNLFSKEDSFLHIEVQDQVANWFFHFYRHLPDGGAVFNGELNELRVFQNPVAIHGNIYIYRIMDWDWQKNGHPNTVGFNGTGASNFPLALHLVIYDDGRVEGTLRLGEGSWTLAELDKEQLLLRYELGGQ